MEHTISLLVDNVPRTLMRLAAIFNTRGVPLKSISIGPSERSGLNRVTIVAVGEMREIGLIVKQLNKILDVVSLATIGHAGCRVSREIALVKIRCPLAHRHEINHIFSVFKGKILDMNHYSVTVEITGTSEKIDSFIALVESYGILESSRSGNISLSRESRVCHEQPDHAEVQVYV